MTIFPPKKIIECNECYRRINLLSIFNTKHEPTSTKLCRRQNINIYEQWFHYRDSPNHQLNEVGRRKIAKIRKNIFREELSSRIPPNNHQNTYINAEKVLPKVEVISPLLFILVEKLSPGLSFRIYSC